MMGYDWLYIEMRLREGTFIFNGKVIGVVSESHDDFYHTIRDYYPGGKIFKSSHYYVNDIMFHSILHKDNLKEFKFTDIIQTSISILNPFYNEIHMEIKPCVPWGYKDTPGRLFEPKEYKFMKI